MRRRRPIVRPRRSGQETLAKGRTTAAGLESHRKARPGRTRTSFHPVSIWPQQGCASRSMPASFVDPRRHVTSSAQRHVPWRCEGSPMEFHSALHTSNHRGAAFFAALSSCHDHGITEYRSEPQRAMNSGIARLPPDRTSAATLIRCCAGPDRRIGEGTGAPDLAYCTCTRSTVTLS